MFRFRQWALSLAGGFVLVVASSSSVSAQSGRSLGEPADVPEPSSLQVGPLLIAAGAIGVIAASIVVNRLLSQRETSLPTNEATRDELRTAKTRIQQTRSVEELSAEAAEQVVSIGNAKGAVVMLGDESASAGATMALHDHLVTRVHREKGLVKLKQVKAVPITKGDSVVGLIAATGGDSETLSAISRFVSDAYATPSTNDRLAELISQKQDDIDGLTGVGNRRRFDLDLAAVSNTEEQVPVSLAMFDIDNFQFYNDAHGKQAGNEVLRSIAELIAHNLRESDVVYRYSGVKFVALLPGANVDNALVVVDRIRSAVESTRFEGEEVQPLGRVTISVGVADAPSSDTTTLIEAAGQALEQAKASGRNKVMIEADIG